MLDICWRTGIKAHADFADLADRLTHGTYGFPQMSQIFTELSSPLAGGEGLGRGKAIAKPL